MKKNKLIRKLFSSLIASTIIFTLGSNAFPAKALTEEGKKEVVLAIEKFTLGQGYAVEPMVIEVEDDENVAQIVTEVLGEENIKYTGSVDSGFYLSFLKDNDTSEANIPQFILDECGSIDERAIEGWLGEFDYTFMSGWMYAVNSWCPNYGMADCIPEDGDVIRLQFTVYGYGMDIGGGYDGGDSFSGSYIELANRDILTTTLAEINSDSNKEKLLANSEINEAYVEAYNLISNLTSSQEDVNEINNELKELVKNSLDSNETVVKELPISVEKAILETGQYMLDNCTELSFGTSAGEWTALCLSRALIEVPTGYFDNYYNNVENTVISKGGKLHSAKFTEYSRGIIGLTSIGKDPRNVGGYDLTSYLSDFNNVKKQGINGPIFALIALDTHDYEIVQDENATVQTTRDMLIDYILDKEIKKDTSEAGGFALSGSNPDPDITAMALQALAPYKNDPRVTPYIERAITKLSQLQEADGGYSSWGTKNVESTSQVLVALIELGIDPAKDSRFIKNGNWLVSSIMDFYVENGGFKHTLNGSINGMATDQAMYALVSYNRFLNGKTSLYDMSDISFDKKIDYTNKVLLTAPEIISAKKDAEFNVGISIGSKPEGNTKLIDGIVTLPEGIEAVSMSVNINNISGGLLDFAVDDNNVLRFVYTNTSLDNINITLSEFPGELFSIKLRNSKDFNEDEKVDIKVEDVSFKEDSNGLNTSDFDITDALVNIEVKVPIAVKARVLYTGDGVDLIPENKMAIAVEAANLEGDYNLIYKNTQLYYSNNLSTKNGVDTYIGIVDNTTLLEDLDNVDNYTMVDTSSKIELLFGDANSDKIINAQDTLDTLSAWIRKTEAPDYIQILEMNVTGDSRINTYDALGIMEYYVNGTEFAIASK